MNEYKNWYNSKTIWGSIIAILAAVASVLGFDVNEDAQSAIVEATLQIVGVAGSLFAVLGRLSATSVIE